MGTRVNVCSAEVLDNPAAFGHPLKLDITFEVFEHLPHDLEWKLIYVGSAESEKFDQELDSVLVGPVPEGRHKFTFEADGPDPTKMPQSEVVGVTVLLLTCSYNNQEFINIGWYVANEYTDVDLKENPPQKPVIEKLQRTILTTDVRVTTFAIKWDESEQSDKANSAQELDKGISDCAGGSQEEGVFLNSKSSVPDTSETEVAENDKGITRPSQSMSHLASNGAV